MEVRLLKIMEFKTGLNNNINGAYKQEQKVKRIEDTIHTSQLPSGERKK